MNVGFGLSIDEPIWGKDLHRHSKRAGRVALSAILSGILLVQGGAVLACEPVVRQVADYAHGLIPNRAVFVGKVIAVDERKTPYGLTLDIRMQVTRWLSGTQPGPVVDVRGSRASPGTSMPCPGMYDFSAKTGEEWLVFGQFDGRTITPDTSLTRGAPGGHVDPKTIRALGPGRSRKD